MPVQWSVEVIDTVPSTQTLAMERAAAGAAEGTVIQSLEQTRGRGRRGNEWHSPVGNLYMSFILRPLCRPDIAGQLAFVMGLALSAAIDPYLADGHKKTLKWPNDLLIDGKKCAGILLESVLSPQGIVDALVIGVGVNILVPPAGGIGVQQVAGDRRVPIHRFRDDLLAQIATHYDGWKTAGFPVVRRDWLAQAHGLNHKITARLPDREEKGIFRDIGPDGALILEAGSGARTAIRAGAVFFPETES